jgi:hypothetical protein
MKNNIKNDKYTYIDASGTIQEYEIENRLGVENLGIKDNSHTIEISDIHNIIIDADSITFRVGEFALKLTDNILTDELKHINKIIINGISFIKEK